MLTVGWTLNAASTSIVFTVTLKATSGWAAIGLTGDVGHSSMDAWTMSFSGTTPTIVDTWVPFSNKPVLQAEPIADNEQGGSDDLTGLTGSVGNGVSTWTFSRLTNTNDARDLPFMNQQQTVVWSYNSQTNDITQLHTNVGMLQLNFVASSTSTASTTTTSNNVFTAR